MFITDGHFVARHDLSGDLYYERRATREHIDTT